jgi:hypothetical protein
VTHFYTPREAEAAAPPSQGSSACVAPGDAPNPPAASSPSPAPSKSFTKFVVRTLANVMRGHVMGKAGWAELNLHRKLDLLFIVLLSVSYIIFASWSLLNDDPRA